MASEVRRGRRNGVQMALYQYLIKNEGLKLKIGISARSILGVNSGSSGFVPLHKLPLQASVFSSRQ